MSRLLLAAAFATAVAPTSFYDRLEKRAGRPDPPPTPSKSQILEAATLAWWPTKAPDELRGFIARVVEPAIATLRAHEVARGSEEICFAASSGRAMRFRCCVYFSTLAAALIERRYGLGGTAGGAADEPPTRPEIYTLLARWFLQPPAHAPPAATARAEALVRAASDAEYDLAAMRAAASQLPGPLGRYASTVRIRGVNATLWRCEIETIHTYLVLQPTGGLDDLLVDVSYRQFLVIPDWMEERHWDACDADADWDADALLPSGDEPDTDAFVGTFAELDGRLTARGLRANMQRVYTQAGDAVETAPFADARVLEETHKMRNGLIFATTDVALRRKLCGRPTTSEDLQEVLRSHTGSG